MGGIFGVCLKNECVMDLFFGTDYHSHLGTRLGGMAVFDGQRFNRQIHHIEKSPFRTKFEPDIPEMKGNTGIGCISDSNPQPIILYSKIGMFALVTVGRINNKKLLCEQLISGENVHFAELSRDKINDSELVASLICRKNTVAEGIAFAQSMIEGSMTMLVCADDGIYAARDKLGRTPLSIGKKKENEGYCISFESFAFINLGYAPCYELGPGEVVFVNSDKIKTVIPPGKKMRICSFLWTYYGYPTSGYEGVIVEEMRYRCGRSIADQDKNSGANYNPDYVAGVPDSGTAHAIGYASQSGIPFARPLIKYTPTWPRSFIPHDQSIREQIAHMKLVPANSLIKNKKLLFIDDSIVRGTQMSRLIDFIYACDVKELHIRLACPPILYNCKYLNFSRQNSEKDLISRRAIDEIKGKSGDCDIAEFSDCTSKPYKNMVEFLRKKLNLTSLAFHSLDGLLASIGIDKCTLCTYCWNGYE
ncbi:MAG: amidophosphoribosyltransferase [Treponema sp.]|nr:amidophosphoribosyltransferase [Treponema sp.]MCL2139628.1 amidophosphoribosyltransferase [Treponema sp.]